MSTKILLTTLSSGCDCRTYTTPKGNEYTFSLGMYTEVKDSEDALHFLNAGDGKVFQVEKGPIKKAIEALKKLVEEEKVDEEQPPEESGILDVDPEAPIDGDEGIDSVGTGNPDDVKEDTDADPEEVTGVISTPTFTHNELKDLNSKQQTFLIKQLTTEAIPRLESGRIELLLKLQDEGANLPKTLEGYVA